MYFRAFKLTLGRGLRQAIGLAPSMACWRPRCPRRSRGRCSTLPENDTQTGPRQYMVMHNTAISIQTCRRTAYTDAMPLTLFGPQPQNGSALENGRHPLVA